MKSRGSATGWRLLAVIGAVLMGLCGAAWAAGQDRQGRREEVWKKIAPYFRPPAELAKDLGTYRSPLVFDDGRPAQTPADWAKRREEILRFWHQALGPWPPLVEKPAIEVLQSGPRENFTQKKVRFPAGPGLQVEGYLLVPRPEQGPEKGTGTSGTQGVARLSRFGRGAGGEGTPGEGRRPAVVVVFYDAEAGAGLNPKSKMCDFGYQLTRRGFVSLSIGWPSDYTQRQSPSLQPLSCLAYVAANAYNALATLPEVDPKRMGIVGHSFGGKWAMFASCLYDKFACAAWSDPGIVFDEKRPNVNYWEPWYLGWEAGRTRKPGVPTERQPAHRPVQDAHRVGPRPARAARPDGPAAASWSPAAPRTGPDGGRPSTTRSPSTASWASRTGWP